MLATVDPVSRMNWERPEEIEERARAGIGKQEEQQLDLSRSERASAVSAHLYLAKIASQTWTRSPASRVHFIRSRNFPFKRSDSTNSPRRVSSSLNPPPPQRLLSYADAYRGFNSYSSLHGPESALAILDSEAQVLDLFVLLS